ncbi:MAG: anion permease [Planctomycetes bacterium]|nr:anion permease [Planctomycetota bacterium]
MLLAAAFLAYANGANDNFKGVATLYGSGTASYRRALAWATLTTLLGAGAALLLGGALVAAFGGKGLVPDAVARSEAFAASVALGAALTVLLATRLGLPVSTTHALVGALVGAGLVAVGAGVDLARLGAAFVLPLLLSPCLALLTAAALYPCLRWARRRLDVTEHTCLCVGPARVLVPVPVSVVGVAAAPGPTLAVTSELAAALPVEVSVGEQVQCVRRYGGRVLGVSAQGLLDALHYLSAGAVCFARALNDTPKVVGIVVVSGTLGAAPGLALAGVAMALGGLVGSRRVAETMSRRAATLNPGSGFAANLVTSALVLGASGLAVPVSTTHVSCGGIFGIGAVTGSARWRVVAQILLAWVTTLPLGAGLAAVVYRLVA